MVEVLVNSERLDLLDSDSIKLSRQISDIFQIAEVKASYTNQFKAPKTPKNTKIFKGLGLSGNTSIIPYSKVQCQVLYKGIPIVNNGWLHITSTSETYNINIIDGIIDFFKIIENKTLGKDLDLSEIDHVKTIDVVANHLTTANPFMYVFGDYGGKNTVSRQSGSNWFDFLNIDYQMPAVKRTFLLTKVFEYAGYSVSGEVFNNPDLIDSYITYPQEPVNSNVYTTQMDAKLDQFNSTSAFKEPDSPYMDFVLNKAWTTSNVTFGHVYPNGAYEVEGTGVYRINIKIKGQLFTRKSNKTTLRNITLRTNAGNYISRVNTVPLVDELEVSHQFTLNDGELITFDFLSSWLDADEWDLRGEYLEVNISKIDGGKISFTDAFTEFSMKDFIKEFFVEYGLTPVINNSNKTIELYSIAQRLNTNNSKDWSSKFVSKTNEIYSQNSYARLNAIRYLYNDQNSDFNDGYLVINDQNLQDVRTLFQSKFYSPTNEVFQFKVKTNLNDLVFNTLRYPIWTSETKEVDNNGVKSIEIEYKGLNNRFYNIKAREVTLNGSIFSEASNQSRYVDKIQVIDTDNSLFVDTVPERLKEYEKVLNNFKCITCNFRLSSIDIYNLDFITPVYLSQEQAYFILNKVNFQSGRISTCELIKINNYI